MRCPYCGVDNDRVVDSRTCEDGVATRRRRECLNCLERYTTFERSEEIHVKVVKKNGVREPFSREKLRTGLQKACWKRPISDAQIDTLVSEVEREVYNRFTDEVESSWLGEVVMTHLAKIDQVAYVRFASVYREFKDARDFVLELQPILGATSRPR